jgi:uroporphyrinogen-III synthase
MRTLYLGLDPARYPSPVFHYPVIRTVPLHTPELKHALALWPQFTHVIFTSRTTVDLWREDLTGKTVIAIGRATAEALSNPLIAPQATQEGVIELLRSLDLSRAYIFLPHSRLARPALTNYLSQNQIRFFSLVLYDTQFQQPEPIPNLDDFDEIVFTSPSTVEGFLRIYKHLPQNKKLTPIGPITAGQIAVPHDIFDVGV